MFAASADDRGTVQALARDLDKACEDGKFLSTPDDKFFSDKASDGVNFSFSPRYSIQTLDGALYTTVLQHLSLLFPHAGLCSLIQPNPLTNSIPLNNRALHFDYVVVNGIRYLASNRAANNMSSLVECVVDGVGTTLVRELTDIIHINQAPHGVFSLARVWWFRPLQLDLTNTIWAA